MKKPLLLIYITGIIIGVSYGMHGPILPIFAKNVAGATYAELGFIGVTNFLPYLIIPLLVGILLDRFNGGYLLSIGVVINSISVYLLAIAQTVPEIIIFRLVSGVAHAFFWPPCESIISDHSEKDQRVKNISKFIMCFVTGFMIGPLLGAWLLDEVGVTYVVLFEITALVMAAAIVASLMVSKHHIKRHHRRFQISALVDIVRFPGIISVLLFCTAAFGLMLTIYPAHLNDRGIGEGSILILYFILGVARVSALVVAGRLAKYAWKILSIGITGVSIGFAISAFADSFVGFAIALVMIGFVLSVYLPLTLEAILIRTKMHSTGPIIGAYETLFGIGWIIGPAVGGLVADVFGDAILYIGLCIVGMSVSLLAVRYRKDLTLDNTYHNNARTLD